MTAEPRGLPETGRRSAAGVRITWFLLGLGVALAVRVVGGRYWFVAVDSCTSGWIAHALRAVAWCVKLAPWAIVVAVVIARRRSPRPTGRAWFFAGTVLAVVLRGTVAVFDLPGGSVFDRAVFSAPSWKDRAFIDHSDRDSPRSRTVDDLLASSVLVGKSREDITALLGMDDGLRGTGYAGGFCDDYDFVWFVGPEPGWISVDSQWLVIKLSPEGKAAEVKTVTD